MVGRAGEAGSGHAGSARPAGPRQTAINRLSDIDDTAPEVHRRLVEGYRLTSPAQKLHRVEALTHGVQHQALARIRAQHPGAGERELKLRLASLWLPADLMRSAFGWDPAIQGY